MCIIKKEFQVFNYKDDLMKFLNKQLLGNNDNNKTKSYSDADIYRIFCPNCQRSYVGAIRRNLPKRIKEHKRDFESANFSNPLVIQNISKKQKFDFQHQTSSYPLMIKTSLES